MVHELPGARVPDTHPSGAIACDQPSVRTPRGSRSQVARLADPQERSPRAPGDDDGNAVPGQHDPSAVGADRGAVDGSTVRQVPELLSRRGVPERCRRTSAPAGYQQLPVGAVAGDQGTLEAPWA